MRTARLLLLALVPALTGGAKIAAQAVERSDVPGRGMLRVTFDPRTVGWDAQVVNGARLPLGLALTGDTVGPAAIPVVARLEQDVRVAPGGRGIVQVVSYLQTRDSAAFNVTGFRDPFLLAHDTLSADLVAGAIVDGAYGFGYRGLPYRNSFRLGLGDIEVAAKYRLAGGGG